MVAKINRNSDSELYEKVISIGIYYVEGAENGGSRRYQSSDKVERNILEYLEDFPEDSIALVPVNKNSSMDTILDFNFKIYNSS